MYCLKLDVSVIHHYGDFGVYMVLYERLRDFGIFTTIFAHFWPFFAQF